MHPALGQYCPQASTSVSHEMLQLPELQKIWPLQLLLPEHSSTALPAFITVRPARHEKSPVQSMSHSCALHSIPPLHEPWPQQSYLAMPAPP